MDEAMAFMLRLAMGKTPRERCWEPDMTFNRLGMIFALRRRLQCDNESQLDSLLNRLWNRCRTFTSEPVFSHRPCIDGSKNWLVRLCKIEWLVCRGHATLQRPCTLHS